jgi:hypothetical protein
MDKNREYDVPDSIRPYLDEIAERVWSERAVVMVGAGFSKNASAAFPDWSQLGDILYQKAYGVKPDPVKQKYLNVSRLAEEVQTAIGYPALENLLRAAIPDLDTEPSDLHVKLLDLPWADIFTTNYDTLLERASAKVETRRYEIVINKNDIPYATKPRIVKLHGSFPSERPFIITEEDYRRYPSDFAPFVNIVQQALLENTLCLIGFSGDDPNFLHWIGWIRDNLGKEKSPKIYLVGLFDFPPARVQLLVNRGIIVIDFSCCVRTGKNGYKKALSKFIEYIENKRPDNLEWPGNKNNEFPKKGIEPFREMLRITENWKNQRLAYPGWRILPNNNRERLWFGTQAWVNFLPEIGNERLGADILYAFELIWRFERCLFPVFDRLARYCEKLLQKYWPFDKESVPKNCLFFAKQDKYKDLPWNDIQKAWLAIALAMLRSYREEGKRKQWVEAEKQLKVLSDYLTDEQKEFINYERFLYSLFTLDIGNAMQQLENWRPKESQPYWLVKRTAALAEMGQISGTDEIIRKSLIETRKKTDNKTSPERYNTVSSEAYQMILLRYIKNASNLVVKKKATDEEEQLMKTLFVNDWKEISEEPRTITGQDMILKKPKRFDSPDQDWENLISDESRKSEYYTYLGKIRDNQHIKEMKRLNSRWDELKRFRCDPWNELKLFELLLSKPLVQKERVTEKRGFDIHHLTKTYHFDASDKQELNAYAFLRFCEEIGLPFRVGSFTLGVETAEGSLQRISKTSAFWATATLFRLGETKYVDCVFARDSVYRYTEEEADRLISNYFRVLEKLQDNKQTDNTFPYYPYSVRFAELLIEVISRLCCKCSMSMKERILGFITTVYASSNRKKYGSMKNLTNRLLNSMSEEKQYNLIPSLLKIRFPENMSFPLKYDFINPFLVLTVYHKCRSWIQTIEIPPLAIEDLLQQTRSDEVTKRSWSISSLSKLYGLGLLNETQKTEFGEVLWCKRDQENGFPDCTVFYKFGFLRLPHPEGVDPEKLFRKYVTTASFPIQKNKQDGVSILNGYIPLVEEIIGAYQHDSHFWSTDEAVTILSRLIIWWDADKERLKEKKSSSLGFSSILEEFRSRFTLLLRVIANVIGPIFSINTPASDDVIESLDRLLTEMRDYGLQVLEAESACLPIYPEKRSDVYQRIYDALASNLETDEKDGLRALGKLIFGNSIDSQSVPGFDPIPMLSQYITWCPMRSIADAMQLVIPILREAPGDFSTDLENAVLKRLDRLLIDTAYDKTERDISFEENLEVRETAAAIAATLWGYYASRDTTVPRIIEEWKESSLSKDEFAEIRNAWKNNENL